MDGRPTWTDCDEAGDYVVPNVLSPRDLVFRPDNMDETVPHTVVPRIYAGGAMAAPGGTPVSHQCYKTLINEDKTWKNISYLLF